MENTTSAASSLDRPVSRRPTEAAARAAIEAWLDEYAPGYPDYSLWEGGDERVAENKCGGGVCVSPHDSTSWVHEDLRIEWYGTGWPEFLAYDPDYGLWHEVMGNAELAGRASEACEGPR